MPIAHKVQPGEYVSLIARKYGFLDFRIVYDDPLNTEFKKMRPDPSVIAPGDIVMIPDLVPGGQCCATGRRNVFRLNRTAPPMLRVRLGYRDGGKFEGQRYILRIAGKVIPGKTDTSGLIEYELPYGIEQAEVELPDQKLRWVVRLGYLDPAMDEESPKITGIQARLNNLGFGSGPVNGVSGPELRRAIRQYQREVLKCDQADGEPDSDFCNALLTNYGC